MSWRSVHVTDAGRIVLELAVDRGAFEVGIRGSTMHWFRVGADRSLCGRVRYHRMREIGPHCFSLHTAACSYCIARLGRERS
jgi:hypothetical protein